MLVSRVRRPAAVFYCRGTACHVASAGPAYARYVFVEDVRRAGLWKKVGVELCISYRPALPCSSQTPAHRNCLFRLFSSRILSTVSLRSGAESIIIRQNSAWIFRMERQYV